MAGPLVPLPPSKGGPVFYPRRFRMSAIPPANPFRDPFFYAHMVPAAVVSLVLIGYFMIFQKGFF